MCKEFIPRCNTKCHILAVLWILSTCCTIVHSGGSCFTVRYEVDRIKRLSTCGQQPNPPRKIKDAIRCRTTCLYKYLRWRKSQRIGLEYIPELLQYPFRPQFTQDTRFCLAFEKLVFSPQNNVTYTVQMGTYTCTLRIWTAGGDSHGPDVKFKDGDYIARFGLQLYGNTQVRITTTYGRLKSKHWDFKIDDNHQRFSSDIKDRMRLCLEALKIEGTAKYPQEVKTYTDHCIPNTFALSYPTQCTSLKFEGGWKRGQTVTSSTWTVQYVRREKDNTCIDIGAAKVYNVVREFTDRHISIVERQLRGGLNRICNEFLFTATFGEEPNTKDYGPYNFKICGYFLVKTTPCIVLKPPAHPSDVNFVPYDGTYTLDARDSLQENQGQQEVLFQWSCFINGTNDNCSFSTRNDYTLIFKPPESLLDRIIKLTLTFTHFCGTPDESSATESRLLKVVNPHDLFITIKCQSNCQQRSVSVTPVVLTAECEGKCPHPEQIGYKWNMTDVTDPKKPRLIVGQELKQLVEDGTVTKQVFSTTVAGNVFLELSRKKGSGDACRRLNYKGAPIPYAGDGCIITPYNAELPGFLEYTYNGLCNWRGNNESLRYKVFVYDVGKPEGERDYELVAFSDISRMPNLELPFGNPNFDYELGVVFYITNADGLTYVYDVKDAFQKIGVVFKVRKPVDYGYLSKVESVTSSLLDKKRSNQFGSRQGVINVAGLVANVIDQTTDSHASGLADKRVQIRETLLSSLAPLANSDVNTVLQLTPIMNKLTSEVSDEVEEKGADVLAPLTEGLRTVSTDYKTTERLSQTQYAVLERISTHSVIHQTDVKKKNLTTEAKKKYVDRANKYSEMFLNIGTGLASSTLSANTTRVVVMPNSAIAVKWLRLRNDSLLSVNKSRTNGSEFGSTVSVSSAALNLSADTEVNVIMSVNERNLFVFGTGSDDLNMPMVNMEVQYRGSNKPVNAPSLSMPVNIFLEKSVHPAAVRRRIWERINITKLVQDPLRTKVDPLLEDAYYTMSPWAVKTIKASDTLAFLLRFNKSTATFTFKIAIDLVLPNGSRRQILKKTDYPRTEGLKRYRKIVQKPDIVLLPRVNTTDKNGSYEVNFTITSKDPKSTKYHTSDAPYLMMLKANLSCYTWNTKESGWYQFGCEATELSTFDVLHCECTHLSVFSGGLLVPANPLDVLEFEAFAEFFNNPAIVSVVVFIWLLYFILIYWAKDEDWLDTFRSRVAVLEDNKLSDKWAYLVCCVTGWWINSSTTAKVFIYIKGTRGMSRVHRLKDEEQDLFVKGAENWFILTTPGCLGKIKSVVVWHDSSGESPAWFLKEVFIQDINTGHSWHCLYNDWLSVEHGTGDLCVEVPALTPEDIHKKRLYQAVLKTSLNIRSRHIWMSIALKPPYSPFTRIQRLTCGLCLILTTMLSSLMFYGIPSNDARDQVSKGPLRLNLQSMLIGVECALVVFPINVLLAQLFSRTSARPVTRKYPAYTFDERELVALEAESKGVGGTKTEDEEIHEAVYEASLGSSDFWEPAESVDGHRLSHKEKTDHRYQHHFAQAPEPGHGHKKGSMEDLEMSSSSYSWSSSDSDEKQNSGLNLFSMFRSGRKAKDQSTSVAFRSTSSSAEHSTQSSFFQMSTTASQVVASVTKAAPRSEPQADKKLVSATATGKSDTVTPATESGIISESEQSTSWTHSTELSTSQNTKNRLPATVVGKDVSVSQNASSDTSQDTNVSARTGDVDPNLACCHTEHTAHSNRNVQESHKMAASQAFHFPSTSAQQHVPIDELHFDSSVKLSSLDTNNSAIESNTRSRNYLSSSGIRARRRPSIRISSQFSSITETQWFQSAVMYLRNNINRMLNERTETNLRHKQNNPDPANVKGQLSKADTAKGSVHHGSYFDKLKEKVKNRFHQEGAVTTSSTFYMGGGDWKEHLTEDYVEEQDTDSDWEEDLVEDDYPKPSYFDKLKTRTLQRQTRLGHSTPIQHTPPHIPENMSKTPSPKACWFCNRIPGHDQTIRHIQTLKKQSNNRNSRRESHVSADTLSTPSGLKTIKAKLKRATSKLKPKTVTKHKEHETNDTEEDSENIIPFETIRMQHDYQYQQALKKGPRALRAFRRQAAQCIAEDMVNANRNALSQDDELTGSTTDQPSMQAMSYEEEEHDEKQDGPESEAVTKKQGSCNICMHVCFHACIATFLCLFICQCPKGSKIPWWTVYFTWSLAILVALASSWVVMLYGLRLGYQRSVDWLSSFFTGWFQNAAILQPLKVIFVSLLYIIVLRQHVNVREEAGVSVHDENNEPLHKAVLRDMEARRRMLDGMWTTTDYEYPVPRSKARDIKLRLEQDARARVILRESLVWAIYLAVVTVAALGHTRVEDAHATNSVLRSMLEEGTAGEVSFEDVGTTEDVWEYTMTTLLPSLYANPNKTTANNVSQLLGTVRLRQVRQISMKDLCVPVMENQYIMRLRSNHCLPAFNLFYAEKRNFDHDWREPLDSDKNILKDLEPDSEDYKVAQAWLYHSGSQLQETPLWGHRAVYPGGGYIVDLPGSQEEAQAILKRLDNSRWLDQDTRALVMSVNLYTSSRDLITAVTIACEWTQEGPVFINLDLHTNTLHWYTTNYEIFESLAEIGWIIMMTFNIYNEMHELIAVGVTEYLSSPWAYLELLNFYLSLTTIAVQMARVVIVDNFIDKIVKVQLDAFVSFDVPRFLDQMLELLKALIFVLVVLKVFKVLRFNRYFRILLQAFYIARFSIFNQTLIAFVLFMAFGIAGTVLFGPNLEDYRSFGSTIFALLSIGLGEGDFYGMQESQPIMGPLLFFLFVIFFSILTISFFVSFVLESFNVSRMVVQLNAEEQHVIKYVVRLWRLLIGHTPKIRTVRRQRRTHPFKQASFAPKTVTIPA